MRFTLKALLALMLLAGILTVTRSLLYRIPGYLGQLPDSLVSLFIWFSPDSAILPADGPVGFALFLMCFFGLPAATLTAWKLGPRQGIALVLFFSFICLWVVGITRDVPGELDVTPLSRTTDLQIIRGLSLFVFLLPAASILGWALSLLRVNSPSRG